jgi:hypothetical protein
LAKLSRVSAEAFQNPGERTERKFEKIASQIDPRVALKNLVFRPIVTGVCYFSVSLVVCAGMSYSLYSQYLIKSCCKTLINNICVCKFPQLRLHFLNLHWRLGKLNC